jgi:hypothetical protein
MIYNNLLTTSRIAGSIPALVNLFLSVLSRSRFVFGRRKKGDVHRGDAGIEVFFVPHPRFQQMENTSHELRECLMNISANFEDSQAWADLAGTIFDLGVVTDSC